MGRIVRRDTNGNLLRVPSGRERLVAGAAIAAAVVSLLLLGFAVFVVVAAVRGSADDRGNALVEGLFAVAGAAALGAIAVGRWRGQGWSRSPSLVVGIILLPVAWGMIQGGLAALGVPLALAGVILVVAAFR
jgi:hypothetical protein